MSRFFTGLFFIIMRISEINSQEILERTDLMRRAWPEKHPDALIEQIILAYRANASETTVHRCPFHTSCSHFISDSLNKKGIIVGTLASIDRYFFRENLDAYNHYPLLNNPNGEIKINDDAFLK